MNTEIRIRLAEWTLKHTYPYLPLWVTFRLYHFIMAHNYINHKPLDTTNL